MTMLRLIIALCVLAWASPSLADGPQLNGTCGTISWAANTETDLAGYYLYDRVTLTATPTQIKQYGVQITSATCASLALNPGQHYLSLRAYDTSGNISGATAEVPFVLAADNQVNDLRVTEVNATDMTLAFTEVQDGSNTSTPAKYDVRYATPTINWGTATSVAAGTCSTPVSGTTIGATKTCTVTGLATTTPYQFQLVPYRGTLGQGAVYGPISNVAGGTTGALAQAGRTALIQDDFTRANAGTLGGDWTSPTASPIAISANNIRPAAAGPSYGYQVHKGELPNDQWCEAVITTISGAAAVLTGCNTRASLTGDTKYTFQAFKNGNGSFITGKVASVSTGNIAIEFATVWANGDVLRGESIGTSHCLYRNNVQIQCGTNTEIISGYAGVELYLDSGVASNVEMDTFRAGCFDRITMVSDTFARANSTGLGNGWQVNAGEPWAIASNLAQLRAAGPVSSREVHATTLPAQQWAQATIANIGGTDYLWVGPMLRYDVLTDTGYQFLASIGPAAGSGITKQLNNQFLSNPNYETATVWANGDIVRAEAFGDELRLYRNGILVLSATDGQFSESHAGLYGFINSGAATNIQVSNFTAGTWVGADADACGCDSH